MEIKDLTDREYRLIIKALKIARGDFSIGIDIRDSETIPKLIERLENKSRKNE